MPLDSPRSSDSLCDVLAFACNVLHASVPFTLTVAVHTLLQFHWEKDGKPTSQRLFERDTPIPAAKMLTFLRSTPFSVRAVNGDTNEQLGEYKVRRMQTAG